MSRQLLQVFTHPNSTQSNNATQWKEKLSERIHIPGTFKCIFSLQHLFSRIWKYWFAAKSALSKLSLLFSVCAQLELVCFLRLYSNAAAVSNKVGPDFCKLSTFFHASAFLHFRNNTDIFSFPKRCFFFKDLFTICLGLRRRKDIYVPISSYLIGCAFECNCHCNFELKRVTVFILLIAPKQH